MVLTYSRIWVRQLLGTTVVCLQSKRLLSVEGEDLRKRGSMVLGKDLAVTATENRAILQCMANESDEVNKTFLHTLIPYRKASLRSDKKSLQTF